MSLFDRIRSALHPDPKLAADAGGAPVDPDVRVATTALLLEAAYGDEEYLRREERAILRGLEREFGLDAATARAIVDEAQWSRPPRRTLEELTRRVRDGYDATQRLHVLALVWKVVDADRIVESFEEVFVDYMTKRLELTPEQSEEARELARQGRV